MAEAEPIRDSEIVNEEMPDVPVIPEIENPVVTVSDLSLYYGETQALFDIGMQYLNNVFVYSYELFGLGSFNDYCYSLPPTNTIFVHLNIVT